ncbi:efflux RND transporter permease subunit [Rhodoferax sp.]|uniref:efflux RND transporter permease subunit n=1 Tax=Rhodoferax sp. TaxID=50421 RepID=UPI002778A545|nr:efflux RND transporter permease subunit [Rhodoferax sp.]
MIERIIEWCARHRWIVLGITLVLAAWAVDSIRKTPLDALPDLSDPQVIVFTDWMGRSPDLVEDQITYPLVRALQSTPGVRTVRGYSMFGMSFVYAIFGDDTDIYWARTRVFEQIGRVRQQLPAGVSPMLGPDASGVGWIYQYVLQDKSGQLNLAELRALQDFVVRPALQGVQGVAEVASIGGFERQYQIVLDPKKLAAYGATPMDVSRAVRDSNAEVGARVLEMGGREYVLRGRGYAKTLEDLEQSVISVAGGGAPIRIRDVASVQFGPDIRRGAGDLDGNGEVVGGIVVMRLGSNALDVIRALETQIGQLSLPPGVSLKVTHDRSELIKGSVHTLRETLITQGAIIAFICLVFLMHAGSALVALIILMTSVLLSFIGMRYLGLSANIMSLGGIAIAVGELSDAAIVLIENAHKRLAENPRREDRVRIIIDSCKEVGRPIFYSLLLITVAFLPILTVTGQAGKLFAPLAYTKTFAMFVAAVLSITLAPPLMIWLLRGRFRTEAQNPLNRVLGRWYRPVAGFIVRQRLAVVALAVLAMTVTIPVFMRMGSEFMPPLDEGALLVMPTTFSGIAIEEARRAMSAQDRIIKGFQEVAMVHGKAGRADTATDPAQLDMSELVVSLKPRDQWPALPTLRWYSHWAPDWLKAVLRLVWPDRRARTMEELSRDLDQALRTPGYQMAIAPPIRTRIDMLTTGVRTPVGIKVFGPDLQGIERLSLELEGMLRQVPGTRSTFAERQSGREYIDIVPRRDDIARHGLSVRDVMDLVEAGVGGMSVSTVIDGRARYSVNVRYGSDFRADPQALQDLLIPIPATKTLSFAGGAGAGRGSSPPGQAPVQSRSGGSAGMGDAGGMGGGGMGAGGTPASAVGMAAPSGSGNDWDRGRQSGTVLPLSALADVRVVTGPPMIKNENGTLVGYVFADIDSSQRDLGGWVDDAKKVVARQLTLPPGYRLQWTGQYEFMAEMEARLQTVIPLTLVLVAALLFLSMGGWPQTWLVMLTVPFAIAGSIWLLSLLNYNLSTAVWVGLIAVGGVAAQTGIVVATTVFGLMPLLWESGVGADLSARTAAPVVGGLWFCMFLTLMVLPAAYALWRRWQFAHRPDEGVPQA